MKKKAAPLWKRALGGLLSAVLKVLGAIWWIFKSVFSFIFRRTANVMKEGIEERERPAGGANYAEFAVLEKYSGDFQAFEGMLLKSSSSVGIILGARGTGKSALGMRLLENMHARTGRAVAAMGFLKESVPSWVRVVEGTAEIGNGAFVLVDEGGITFSARRAMSDANKILSELLLIARHRDLSILFISQNSSNLDVNAIRQADYLLLRKSSLLQRDFERKKIRQVYGEAQQYFEAHPESRQKLTYVYSDEFRGFVSNPLPSFWSEGASKAFRRFGGK